MHNSLAFALLLTFGKLAATDVFDVCDELAPYEATPQDGPGCLEACLYREYDCEDIYTFFANCSPPDGINPGDDPCDEGGEIANAQNCRSSIGPGGPGCNAGATKRPSASPVGRPTRSPDPTTAATTRTACFSAHVEVQVLKKGKITMMDLQVGDLVLAGNGNYERVYAFGHLDRNTETTFLKIETWTSMMEAVLEVTGNHLVFLENQRNPVRADSIKAGDILHRGVSVTNISTVTRSGMYAPLTMSGSLIAAGVKVSSYISLQGKALEFVEFQDGIAFISQHDFIHMVLSPFRVMARLGLSALIVDADGTLCFAPLGIQLAEWLDSLELSITVQMMIFSVVTLVGVLFSAMEISFLGVPLSSVAPLWLKLIVASTILIGVLVGKDIYQDFL